MYSTIIFWSISLIKLRQYPSEVFYALHRLFRSLCISGEYCPVARRCTTSRSNASAIQALFHFQTIVSLAHKNCSQWRLFFYWHPRSDYLDTKIASSPWKVLRQENSCWVWLVVSRLPILVLMIRTLFGHLTEVHWSLSIAWLRYSGANCFCVAYDRWEA